MSDQRHLVRLVAVNPDGYSLGLAYLEAALAARFGSELRVEQSIVDMDEVCRRTVDIATLAAGIAVDQPTVVGLSWYCWNHRLVQDLARIVHSLAPACQIIVGGPETRTINEAELMAFPEGTLFVTGEGEAALVTLVEQALAREADETDQAGLAGKASQAGQAGQANGADQVGGEARGLPPGTARRTAGELIRAPRPAAAIPPDQIASPVLAGTLHSSSQAWLPSYATTRGCVFKCSFCAWQDGYREREFDLDTVMRELDTLAEWNHRVIWITDTIFGRNEPRTMRIIKRLQEWPTDTRFGIELHAKYLSEELCAELAKVRLDWAAIGIQSLAPDVLKLTRRSPHTEELFESVSRLYRVVPDRSVIHLDIIFGLPRQTLSDCFGTVDLLMESFPDATIFTGILQVVPGTAFESLHNEPGWTVLPPEGDFEVAATPQISAAEMARIRDLAAGLDAYVIGRDLFQTPVNAARLEEVGRSLRGTPFGAHPIYGRREGFTAEQVAQWTREAEAVHA